MLHERLGPLWPVILAVVVVALVWAFFRGGSALMRILAVTGMVAGIAYIFTPLTASGSLDDPSGFDANLRYVAPVLTVGFLLLPLIPWIRHGNRPWILIGLFTILLVQGTVIQSNWEFSHHLASIGTGVPDRRCACVDRRRPAEARQHRRASSAFGLVMLVTAVALGRVRENYYLDHRYVTAVAPAARRRVPRDARSGSRSRTGGGRRATSGSGWSGGPRRSASTSSTAPTSPTTSSTSARSCNRGTFRPIVNCAAVATARSTTGHYDYIVTTPKIGADETVAPPESLWTDRDKNVQDGDPVRARRRLPDHRPARPGDLRASSAPRAHT